MKKVSMTMNFPIDPDMKNGKSILQLELELALQYGDPVRFGNTPLMVEDITTNEDESEVVIVLRSETVGEMNVRRVEKYHNILMRDYGHLRGDKFCVTIYREDDDCNESEIMKHCQGGIEECIHRIEKQDLDLVTEIAEV